MKPALQLQGRLLLLRHGQAEANVHGAFLGRRDDALTPLGKTQAHHLAQLLSSETIHQIICSPLRRAKETAVPLSQLTGRPLIEDARLLEQDYGQWEGLVFQQAEEKFPQDYATWRADARTNGPTAGENLNQVSARVTSLYKELHMSDGHTYVLVAHGGCLQALLCHIFQIPTRAVWPFRLANGSITEVQFTSGGPSLTRMSAT